MGGQSTQLHVGSPGVTYSVASTDAAQALAAAKLYLDGVDHTTDADYKFRAVAVHITIDTEPIRIAFGVNPTTSLGHRYLINSILPLASWADITNFKFISAVAGQHATLQVTVYF